jgi:hypothetical protein
MSGRVPRGEPEADHDSDGAPLLSTQRKAERTARRSSILLPRRMCDGAMYLGALCVWNGMYFARWTTPEAAAALPVGFLTVLWNIHFTKRFLEVVLPPPPAPLTLLTGSLTGCLSAYVAVPPCRCPAGSAA